MAWQGKEVSGFLRRGHPALKGTALALAMFGFYAGSIGPAYRLLRCGLLPQRIFTRIYAPATSLLEKNQLLDKGLDWYLDLWYSDVKMIGRELQRLAGTQEDHAHEGETNKLGVPASTNRD